MTVLSLQRLSRLDVCSRRLMRRRDVAIVTYNSHYQIDIFLELIETTRRAFTPALKPVLHHVDDVFTKREQLSIDGDRERKGAKKAWTRA